VPTMAKFKSLMTPGGSLLMVGIAAIPWQQSPIAGAMIIIVGVILIAAHVISRELKRVEARLVGSDDDEHDQKIDEQVSRASEEYWKRLEILKTEKEKLPKIDTWDIDTIPNWEQYLIERAKSLRGLINMTRYAGDAIKTRDVPMDYYFAHALAEFAHLQTDLRLTETEWAIKRIEVLGSMRKRWFDFKSIIGGERELREVEKQIAAMEEKLPTCEHEIHEAFERARDRAYPV
jgi:hypothetical protein